MSIGLLEAALGRVAEHYSPAVLASSLSVEDMVLTDAIARHALPIEVFVLDTGRLHADTLSLIQETQDRYGIAVRVYPYAAVRATGAFILIDEATNRTVAAGMVQ